MENRLNSNNFNEEWIYGIKYMSPRPQYNHVAIQGHIFITFSNYFKNNCKVINEADTFLTTENIDEIKNDKNKLYELLKDKEANVVPDLLVICDKRQIISRGIIGIPNIIVEILSPSNSTNDTITKFKLYEEYKVPEYWILDPMTQKTFIWILENERYVLKVECGFDTKFSSPRIEDLEVDLSSIELVENDL